MALLVNCTGLASGLRILEKKAGGIWHKVTLDQTRAESGEVDLLVKRNLPKPQDRPRPDLTAFTGIILHHLHCQSSGFKQAACSCWATVKSVFHYKAILMSHSRLGDSVNKAKQM